MMYLNLYSARLDNALSYVRSVEVKRIELSAISLQGRFASLGTCTPHLVSSKPTLEYNKLTVIINTMFATIIDIIVFSISNQYLTYELLFSTTEST